MRLTLLIVSLVLIACIFAQGYAKNNNELDGNVKSNTEVNDRISSEARIRKKKTASKNKRKRKNIKKNKKKGRKRRKGANGKKNKGKQNRKINSKKQKDKKIKKMKRKKRNKKGKKNNPKPKGNQNKRKHKKKLIRKDDKKKNGIIMKASREECQDSTVLVKKVQKIQRIESIKKTSLRTPNQHKVIGNKCLKATKYTKAAKRLRDTINRVGGRENCKEKNQTKITETLSMLDSCESDVCNGCVSPLNFTWQQNYPTCRNDASKNLKDLKDAKSCVDIQLAIDVADRISSTCDGPSESVRLVLRIDCIPHNKRCKLLKEDAENIADDCNAPVDLLSDPSVEDETQNNRTSKVETSLDTFINGTGDLLNNLGLSSGEGSDGTLSADVMAVVGNITRINTISDKPTCDDLISYSANLVDFSASAEQQTTLSEEQTNSAQSTLGTINNLVSTGAAETALKECNTRQTQPYVAIFRWIVWQCYYFFYNYLRRSRCRRLARLCLSRGEPWCMWYCNFCEIPELTGGIWWLEPVFTYEWYPVDPCTERNRCIFQCPQCPVESTKIPTLGQTTTTSGAMSTAQGRRAKLFKAFLKKAKKIN